MSNKSKGYESEKIKKGFLDSPEKKLIFIIIEVAVLLTLVITVFIVLNSTRGGDNNPTKYVISVTSPTTEKDEISDIGDILGNSEGEGASMGDGSDIFDGSSETSLQDPTGWSVSKILSVAGDAVNKTRSFKGSVGVNHSESFVADVTECTGGEIVKRVVNIMIGWIVKPVNESLVFNNGAALNGEGEIIPLGLPIRNSFNLKENGVKSATIRKSGNEYIINIKLVKESVGMYEVPTHNAASIGYLDVAGFDISFMTVDSADIIYEGSTIELRINSQGYLTAADYEIPMHIEGSAHRNSISGSAVFDGVQTEKWEFNW